MRVCHVFFYVHQMHGSHFAKSVCLSRLRARVCVCLYLILKLHPLGISYIRHAYVAIVWMHLNFISPNMGINIQWCWWSIREIKPQNLKVAKRRRRKPSLHLRIRTRSLPCTQWLRFVWATIFHSIIVYSFSVVVFVMWTMGLRV